LAREARGELKRIATTVVRLDGGRVAATGGTELLDQAQFGTIALHAAPLDVEALLEDILDRRLARGDWSSLSAPQSTYSGAETRR
jgi:hypothetical protein